MQVFKSGRYCGEAEQSSLIRDWIASSLCVLAMTALNLCIHLVTAVPDMILGMKA